MRKNGFTLIELMVVLAIIMIIATASVPQVQLWTARNRGATAVAQIISDFSKAKSIAAYSVNDTYIPGAVDYTRTRRETAIMFRTSSYSILQRTDSTAWEDVSPLKRTALPLRVSITNLNGGGTNDSTGYSPTLVFTSTGKVKRFDNSLVPPGAQQTLSCGSGISSPLDGRRVFVAVLRVIVKDGFALWYQVEIDPSGEVFVCVEPGTDSAPASDFGSDSANILEI